MQATNVEESVSATKADSTGLQVELEEAAGRRSAGEAPGSGSSARSWFKKQDQLRDPEYESLLEIVGKLVKTKLLERHQQELARLTSALNALRQQNDTSRWKAARLALSALEATEPNIEL